MKTVNYTMLRSDMKQYMDDITNNDEIISVKRKDGNVILLSENAYNQLNQMNFKVKEPPLHYSVNHIEIDPILLLEAEEVLSKLSISTKSAIEMFLRQVQIKQGIPFDLSLSCDPSLMSDEELMEDIERSLQQVKNGKTISMEEFYEKFKKEHGWNLK